MQVKGESISRRQFVQRSAASVALLTSLGVLEACGGNTTTTAKKDAFAGARPPAAPTGIFRRSYGLEVDTFDPAVSVAGGLLFIATMYEGLVRYSDDWTHILPNLATAWKQSDDAREWEFELRQNVRFHDDEPFDAAAIKHTFDYFKAKGSLAATLLPDFAMVDTSDPTRIRFALKQPAGDFLRNQSFLKIMSPKVIRGGKKAIEGHPAGTGPYKFANRKPGRSITLDANERYWGSGPYFKQLEWQLIPDASARLNALRSRAIDQTNSLSPEVLAQFARASDLEILERPGWRISYLHFPVTNTNVSDKRVRQAIAYAIDRPAIVKRLLDGKGRVATSVMPFGIYGHVDATPQYTYDPDRSKQLLRDAGSGPGHKVRMVVFPEATVRGADVSQAIVGQLKDAGFDATLDISDATVVTRELGKPRPRWDMYYNEHSWLNGGPVIFSIALIEALTRFKPKRLEDLNAAQKATPDGPQRLKVLADMQNLIQEEAPYIALHIPDQIDAEQTNIQGYTTPPDAITYRYTTAFRAAT